MKKVLFKKDTKKKFHNKDVKWINNFNKIKKGPVIFLEMNFLMQFQLNNLKKLKILYLKKIIHLIKKNKIKEIFKKAKKKKIKIIKSYKTLKKLNFIELPKLGFLELKKMTKKISKLKGCILLIDYGYLKPNNQSTLQSVIKHKKKNLLNNLGKADVTSHVNFKLLK